MHFMMPLNLSPLKGRGNFAAWTCTLGMLGSSLLFGCADGGGGGSDGSAVAPNTNTNVQATAPADGGANVLAAMQSEPRIARADEPGDGGLSHYVLAYNDTTGVIQAINDAGILVDGGSEQGWAETATPTGVWNRHVQMAVPNDVGNLVGDPWLAARGSTVLMVGVGFKQRQQQMMGDTRWPILWISNDAGATFGAPHVLTQGCSNLVTGCLDGPKIAISNDASRALLVWHDEQRRPVLMVLSGFANDTVNVVRGPTIFEPLADDDSDNPGQCLDADVTQYIEGHPQVAIGGLSNNVFTMYLAYSITYDRCAGTNKRHVVFRSRDEGQSWQRVMSVQASLNPPQMFVLNRTDPSSPFLSRDAARPTIAISRANSHDVLLLAAEHFIAATGMEQSQMKIRQYRLQATNGAEGCTYTTGDLTSCGQTLQGLDVDQSFQMNGSPMLNRQGAYEFYPTYFTGDASAEDARVGLVWYAQPLRGGTYDGGIKTETVVEGVIAYSPPGNSPNAGAAYGPVKAILEGNDLSVDNTQPVGAYFLPCGEIETDIGSYFGDYIGGAFFSSDTNNPMALASWTDSRFGCTDQRLSLVHHQHVVIGGTWY